MKKKLRRLFIILLVVTFVGSAAMILRQLYEQSVADRAYEEASRLAWQDVSTSEDDENADTRQQESLPEQAWHLLELDLAALQETNEDVLGWIYIPDTAISYPLMQSKDNKEYLSLTWDKTYSSSGSIFLECKNRTDLSNFHTMIYGHNMLNETMFSQLTDYQDQAFADSHSCVYIATDDAILRYEVFSAYKANINDDTYRLYFEDNTRKQSVIDFYLEQSKVESEIVPTVEDRILTLSTCTDSIDYSYRWVVHTVLTGQFTR